MKKEQSFSASPEREDRYVPKQYTTAEQLVFAAKAVAAVALVVLVIWLLEKSL